MAINENGNLVEFYRDAVRSDFKSSEAGRPIYEEYDFVRISVPGDASTVVVERVSDQHKRRYPKAWAAYEGQIIEAVDGTPLSAWTQISVSQVKELGHLGVRTVEQFADMADANVLRLGPGYQHLHNRAKQFLAASADGADATAVHRENEALKERVALLEAENAALKQQSGASQTEKRGPGRPPKGATPDPVEA